VEISYQNNGIVAEAFSDNKLVRVYTGNSNGSVVELSTQLITLIPLLQQK
jgi:hypothetical protein